MSQQNDILTPEGRRAKRRIFNCLAIFGIVVVVIIAAIFVLPKLLNKQSQPVAQQPVQQVQQQVQQQPTVQLQQPTLAQQQPSQPQATMEVQQPQPAETQPPAEPTAAHFPVQPAATEVVPVPGVTPVGEVVVEVLSSNTKEDWMNFVTAEFNNANFTLPSGEKITINVKHGTSGFVRDNVKNGLSTPVMISPGDISYVDGLNKAWISKNGKPLITEQCMKTVESPIGLCMWQSMAQVLGWPDTLFGFETLNALSEDPQGWGSYGHPEWGALKGGHTDPSASNTGNRILANLAYFALGKTFGLTALDIHSEPVVSAFSEFEKNIYHYGKENRLIIDEMMKNGPQYLHFATSSEAEVLKANAENKSPFLDKLVFVFPSNGVFWSEQPMCILDQADWVSEKQKEAAEIYRNFLLSPKQQAAAVDYYLRPIDPNVPLHAPIDLEGGTDPRVNMSNFTALEIPPSDVTTAINEVFNQTKKRVTVDLVIDTSESMRGEKLDQAKAATINFLGMLDPNDTITVFTFSSSKVTNLGGGRVGDVKDKLTDAITNLSLGINTPLYDAVCTSMMHINQIQKDDLKAGIKKLYGLILLSDGDEYKGSHKWNAQTVADCLPSGDSVDQVKIFPIGYGQYPNEGFLKFLALQTNGIYFPSPDPKKLNDIFSTISVQQ
jgi:Ca-activated chloride channel homolog